MTHLLVTNDFPPKIGGIQSYLYELWRRLPPDRFAVLTIGEDNSEVFDLAQNFRIRRLAVSMLYPKRAMRTQIESYATEIGATHIVLDPVLPIGLIGPSLSRPYSLVVHGAEINIPGRLPLTRQLMRRSIRHAKLIIAAGSYPANETRRIGGKATPEIVVLPPGVDVERFCPLDDQARLAARQRFEIASDTLCVVSVSRLVPRKGIDILIEAVGLLAGRYPQLELVIGGAGRDLHRLQSLVQKHHARVRFLGRVEEVDLPGLYASADIAAMLCRNRWFGLEQEGFGIVFLEAAATGTATIAGESGGASEAVLDGVTGLVVPHPKKVAGAVQALQRLLDDQIGRQEFGERGRNRVVHDFDYEVLAERLSQALLRVEALSPQP
jgi:phosphatidylinositol alpha-1,6-mannosyltransferase